MIRCIASLGAAVVMTVGATAAPAHAEGEVGLSNDGSTWGSTLATPLFEPDFVWVPGDVEERSFLVRNDGPTAALLTVDVGAADPDELLAEDDFLVQARVGDGRWVEIEPGDTRLHQGELPVAEGATTTVTLRGTFRPESTRQNGVIPLRAEVTLVEDSETGGVEDGTGDGNIGGLDDDSLPDTGSSVASVLLWVAATLIGAGLALVLPRRGVAKAVNQHG